MAAVVLPSRRSAEDRRTTCRSHRTSSQRHPGSAIGHREHRVCADPRAARGAACRARAVDNDPRSSSRSKSAARSGRAARSRRVHAGSRGALAGDHARNSTAPSRCAAQGDRWCGGVQIFHESDRCGSDPAIPILLVLAAIAGLVAVANAVVPAPGACCGNSGFTGRVTC